MSIVTNSENCFLCGRPATDTHHCLIGSYRQKADEYGITVRLCRECHNYVHSSKGAEQLKALKQIGQQAFEDKYGHEKFMKVFGRSWL